MLITINVLLLGLTIVHGQNLIGRPDLEVNEYFRRKDGITSGDGGYSLALNNGGSIWLFSDSHYNDMSPTDTTQPCIFQVHNAAMVQSSAKDWSHEHTQTLVGPPTPIQSLFKTDHGDAENKDWYWLGAGIQLGDSAYVYCAEIELTDEGGQWGFINTGNDHWGKINLNSLDVSGTTKLPDFNGINFGSGFVDNNDGYIYAFGQKTTGWFENSLFLARFQKDRPEAQDSWQYWDGEKYQDQSSLAKGIATDPVNGISVIKVKDKYVMFSTEFSVQCDQGHYVYARISDQLTGPFTDSKPIHSIDEAKVEGHYPFFYMAIGHPEHINDKNELLVTYSINDYSPCLQTCQNNRWDPDNYRLRGFRVNIDELFALFQ